MAIDSLNATLVINAPAEAIFAVLADPAKHAAIDGTGWVGKPLDPERLSATGQVFRVAMYHPGHPNGDYQMANRIQKFDPPSVVAWEPCNETAEGTLTCPGWIWRYDLTPEGPTQTSVVLTYDWSAVAEPIRQRIGFPPFPPEHLANSLGHLAELVGR